MLFYGMPQCANLNVTCSGKLMKTIGQAQLNSRAFFSGALLPSAGHSGQFRQKQNVDADLLYMWIVYLNKQLRQRNQSQHEWYIDDLSYTIRLFNVIREAVIITMNLSTTHIQICKLAVAIFVALCLSEVGNFILDMFGFFCYFFT